MNNLRSTNLRFNLDKETHRKAWDYLQSMDKQQFKSYSNVIAVSVVSFFERYYKLQNDPYFETREREERFVDQIVGAVESAMDKMLPVFLAGCMTGINHTVPAAHNTNEVKKEDDSEPELDWDFLGG